VNEITKYLAAIGRRGGKAKSAAKIDAARANAKRGGWPKGRKRGKRVARRQNTQIGRSLKMPGVDK
jgi:phage gp16-like protein